MRITQIATSILASLVALTMGGVSFADAKREEKPRFKGVELYSWKGEKDTWVFVMLDGTNLIKPTDEVKKAENQLSGVGPLKDAFRKLAKGEQVSWVHRIKGFEFPPEEVQKEIATAAKEAEVILSISRLNQ